MTTMPITLQNLERRPAIFHLTHAEVCTEKKCHCGRRVTAVQDHDPKTGLRSLRATRRRVADTITLMAAGTEGDTLEGLPDGVIHVDEVARAIRARRVKWSHTAAKVAKPAEPESKPDSPPIPPPPAADHDETHDATAPAAGE